VSTARVLRWGTVSMAVECSVRQMHAHTLTSPMCRMLYVFHGRKKGAAVCLLAAGALIRQNKEANKGGQKREASPQRPAASRCLPLHSVTL
jgi:hypothetical protein